MVKKLPFRSILKILKNHPRKDRKMIFLAMYFGNPTKKFPNMGIKNYVKEIHKLENSGFSICNLPFSIKDKKMKTDFLSNYRN